MFVYVLRGGGFIKFGISRDLTRRHKNLTSGTLPFPVTLVCYAVLEDDVARLLERALLNWELEHAHGEWFVDDGRTDEAIGAYIRQILGPDLGEMVFSDQNPERHIVRTSKIANLHIDIMRRQHLSSP
jgi:hypothetical protein